MDDLNIIDQFTQTFSRYIETGFGLLAGDVAFLTTILIGIDITLAGLFWALQGEDNIPAQLIRKVLMVGFFALLLNNFSALADIVFQSFAGLGLKASGSTLTADDLMRPGFVAETGFTASRPLLEKAGELIGFTSFFQNFVTIAILLIAWLIVLLSFFLLAVQLFIAILEFKLTTLAGFVLVPFALFGRTAFLAERVLGNVIASGIKLMVLAIVIGIGSTLFGTIATPPEAENTLAQASAIILAAIAVFGLAIFVPGIAAGLISGAPQLGAGAAIGTAAGLAATGVGAATLTGMGARTSASAGSTAIRSAASLSGTAQAAYGTAGLSGLSRAMVTEPAKRAMNAATAPVRDAYREGSAQGYRDAGGSGPHAVGAGAMSASPAPEDRPGWARKLERRQRLREAGLMAAQALREGDRPASASGPDLKDKT